MVRTSPSCDPDARQAVGLLGLTAKVGKVCAVATTALALAVSGWPEVPAVQARSFSARRLPPSLPSALPRFDLGPIEDQLEIIQSEYELLAVDAWSGSVAIVDLGIEEEILWSGVRGRVALVITDQRFLAALPGLAGWTERETGVFESPPQHVVVGDRVALLATDRRVLALDGLAGTWSETQLGPRERVLQAGAGTNVAVAVTRTRVLGVAAARGGLFESELGIREDARTLRVHGSFATVTTRDRLLTFRAPGGTWQSTELPFR